LYLNIEERGREMENSIFLAKIIGPYLIIVGIGVLLNLKTYQNMIGDFVKNSALLYLGGVIALLVGLLLVLIHNVWIASWIVIITIIGWLGIMKGAWLIIFPNTVGKLTDAYQNKTGLLVVHLFIALALGIFLTLKGYLG
jgi:hypothetical protein